MGGPRSARRRGHEPRDAAPKFAVVWGRQGADALLVQGQPARCGSSLDETVRANGNKPISSLGDFTEPHCLSVMIYTRGGGKPNHGLQPVSSPGALHFEECPCPQDVAKPLLILSHGRLRETRGVSRHPEKRTVNQERAPIPPRQTRAPPAANPPSKTEPRGMDSRTLPASSLAASSESTRP